MARPAVERLERRCLLAAEFGPLVQDGTLFLFLDGENDQVSFGLPDAETARLTLNGAVFDYAQSDVRFLLFTGGGGNDQIRVAPDVTIAAALDGEDGNDHLVGGAAEDLLEGGLGNDTMLGGAGDNVIDAIDRFLCFYDSFGNEICGPPPASQSQDSVDAGDGDDFVMGDATNDTLDGGSGDNDFDTSQGDSNCVQVAMSYSAVEPVSQADTVLFAFPDPSTARVTVNGNTYEFEQSQVICFMADAEQGDDSIQMDASVTVPATLWGGEGNDTLAGGSGADSFYGGAGDDSLVGNDGNDTISGETGSDSVDGGAGNDPLDGGDGGDSVSGGTGDDALGDGMGDDTLDGGGGNDIFNLTPGSDDDVRDSLGTNTLSFAGAARGITIDLGLAAGQRQAVDAARNTVSLRGVFHHVIGSGFADDLTGNEQQNRLEGGGGDDTLDGGGGDRSLRGQSSGRAPDRRSGAGCDGDTLVGQTGHDWLDGGRGRDRLDGGDGDDVLVGDAARDTLSGGGGANREIRVTKSSARCAASGGGQARGRAGRGGVAAGNGLASSIQFDPIAGLLGVQGDAAGPRDDVIVVSTRGERLSERQFVEVIINGVVHSSRRGSGRFDPALAGATVRSVRSIQVQGLEGNDQLAIQGVFRNANGRVTLDGGTGADDLVGSALSETLLGGDGDDAAIGGRGNDSVLGGHGVDVLEGGRGDDTLAGGAGRDYFDGGPGTNTLIDGPIFFDRVTGALTVSGDDDEPTNDLIGVSTTNAGFVNVEINRVVHSSDPAAIGFSPNLDGALQTTVTSLLLQGLAGNDVVRVQGNFSVASGRITIEGGDGDDLLVGSSADERIDGGDANDRLSAAGGNDTLLGGPGDDFLVGGAGNDSLDGGSGANELIDSDAPILFDPTTGLLAAVGDLNGAADDVMTLALTPAGFVEFLANGTLHSSDPAHRNFDPMMAGASATSVMSIAIRGLDQDDRLTIQDGFVQANGRITLDGGMGDDTLVGASTDEFLAGGAGADLLEGGPGNDTASGGPDGDAIYGNDGSDLIAGDEGEDFLFGNDGPDTLKGGNDFDMLWGGAGSDHLLGEADGDVLFGEAGDDLLEGGEGNDSLDPGTIEDLDTALGGPGNDEFVIWAWACDATGCRTTRPISDIGPGDTLRPDPISLNTALATNTNLVWSHAALDLAGRGIEVGVFDQPWPRVTHQEFGGRVSLIGAPPSPVTSSHATEVTGILAAAGIDAQAQGMAAAAVTVRAYSNSSSPISSDMTRLAADPFIRISNHSYVAGSAGWGNPTVADCNDGRGFILTDFWGGNTNIDTQEDYKFGKYDDKAQALDAVLSSNPELVTVVGAGNERVDQFLNKRGNGRFLAYNDGFTDCPNITAPPANGNGGTGYDSLPPGLQTAKNAFVVGSVLFNTSDPTLVPTVDPTDPTTVQTSGFTSYGPTDDGRLGVMLAGLGHPETVLSSNSDDQYTITGDGTSLAAPNVAGSLALAMEHYYDTFGGYADAATIKALALHTALDVNNVGPDYATGYGLLDMAALTTFVTCAAEPGSGGSMIIADRLGQNQIWTRNLLVGSNLAAPPTRNFKATLIWTDPPGPVDAVNTLDEGSPDLVNDLELRIQRVDSSGNVVETYFPWVLDRNNPAAPAGRPNSGNHVDVVEQVVVQGAPALQPNGEPWRYWIRIDRAGNLVAAPQAFSLIVSAGSVQVAWNASTGTVGFAEALAGNPDCLILRRGSDDFLEYSTDGVTFSRDLDTTQPEEQSVALPDINQTEILLQGGNDQLLLDYASGRVQGPTRAGLLMHFDGGAGIDTLVDTRTGDAVVTLNGTNLSAALAGGGRSDTLANVERVELIGDGAANSFSAGGVNNTSSPIDVRFRGLGGNDTLTGGVGNDTISGGLGNDSLTGGTGTDGLLESRDQNFTWNTNNTLTIGGETDTVASLDEVRFTGGTGNNRLDVTNFAGAAFLAGGVGNDTLLGGSGNDTLNGGTSGDSINGSDGTDRLFVEADCRSATITFNAGLVLTQCTTGAQATTTTDTFAGMEQLLFRGRSGNETLINNSGLPSTLSGGAGHDTLSGGIQNDLVDGGPGDDSILGGAGNDTLTGSDGSDTLGGQGGSDSIDGGTGITGIDRLMESADGKITLKDGQLTSQMATDTFTNIEQVSLAGGAMKDTITAKKFTLGPVTIVGGAGDDAITGTNGADVIRGEAGNDTIKEVNGPDLAEGGDGNDNLNGGNENDTLLGEAGGDKLTGGKGDDSLDGGTARDTLNGSAGTDTCSAGPTNEGDSIKGCEP